MDKCVLISINPRWVNLIAEGIKTIEVRKTAPKLKPPFKCYIYCTKGKEQLIQVMKDGDENYGEIYHGKPVFIKISDPQSRYEWRGMVMGEFTCDKIITIDCDSVAPFDRETKEYVNKECFLTRNELFKYTGGKCAYGWHISDLKIYKQAIDIHDFAYTEDKYCEPQLCGGCPFEQTPSPEGDYEYDCEWYKPMKRPPQSWCYVQPWREPPWKHPYTGYMHTAEWTGEGGILF